MATKEEVIAAIKEFSESEKKEVKEALGVGDDKSATASGYDLSGDIKQRQILNESIKKTAELLGNAAEASKAELDIMLGSLKERGIEQDKINELINNENAALTDALAASLDLGDIDLERLRHLTKIQRGQENYGRGQKKLLDDIASGIGITMRLENSFLGSVMKVTSQLVDQGEAGEQARAAFAENLKSIISWENVALSAFTAILEVTMATVVQFDNARAKLAGLTGAGYEFSDSMFDAQRQANLMGVSMDDAAGATGALFSNTTNFVNISKEAQGELIATTAMMGKLGIDSATAAENFQFFNLVLGMTAEQANDAQVQLAMMGTELGISSAKITKDFQSALPTLAVYGRESVEVFQGLAAAAKAAGVETSALLGIAKKFDTFAGAAEGSAKLNALLGTQLSTTEMLMMTEEERIETMIASVQAQGVAFGDMDKYTQMAIANAAGITDMNEANKIFGMDLGQYDDYKGKMDENAAAQEKFESAVAKTVPVFNQFKLLATEFIVAVEPLLDMLTAAAAGMTEFLGSLTQGEKEMLSATIAIVTGGALLFKVATSIAAAFTAVATTAPAAAGGVAAVGAAAEGVMASMTALIVGTGGTAGLVAGALLGGMLVIGGTIALVMASYASMADSQARTAEAQAKMLPTTTSLAESSSIVLENLTKLGETDFSTAISGMSVLIAKANEFGNMTPQASATIENLALLTTGRAKDSMTNKVVQASTTNIQNNVENVFKGMEMVVKIQDVGPLKGYVEKVSQKSALGM